MKFLVIGTHAEGDLIEEFRRVGEAHVRWIEDGLAAGTFDCAYSREGGGLLLIADADSDDQLQSVLATDPGLAREWTVTRLADAVETNRRALA